MRWIARESWIRFWPGNPGVRVALLQLTSSDDPRHNSHTVQRLIDEAVAGGAEFVMTPEVTNCLSASRTRQQEVLRSESEDETLATLQEVAARAGIHLLIGSLALKSADADEPRFINRSFLIGPNGQIQARYDKIHMFDVAVTATETYRESDGYRPGDRAVVADVGDLRLGMTICYDVRFPHLYRRLAQAGAQMITVPSAFSPVTGQAHWEPLLRARAIETGAYILAPAQTGLHAATRGRARQTHGHSLAVDPWGVVLADASQSPGVTFVEVQPELVTECRARIPSLFHDRDYLNPQ